MRTDPIVRSAQDRDQDHERDRERERTTFILLATALLLTAVLLAGAMLLRLGANHWAPFGTGVGERIAADHADAGADLSTRTAAVDDLGELRRHWDGAGRWGLRSPSGDLLASISSVRLAEDDPAADYYVATVATTWTHGSGTPHLPAPVEITVTSDADPLDRGFGATDSFLSEAGCEVPVRLPATARMDLGLNGGSAQACPGYGVELVALQQRTATWLAVQPEGLRSVDLEFSQRVAPGVVPRWSVTVKAAGSTR